MIFSMTAQPESRSIHLLELVNGMTSIALRCLLSFLLLANSAWSDLKDSLGFAELRYQQNRANFQDAMTWISRQHEGEKNAEAVKWCLNLAYEHGWYAEVLPLASEVFVGKNSSTEILSLAGHVRCLGLASTGKTEESVEAFAAELKKIRLRSPNPILKLTYALSSQLQILGEIEAAQEVLAMTRDAFFLNEEVRIICDRRLAKLLLFGLPAEEFGWKDVKQNPGHLSEKRGQLVLLDFWATNCAPCLADLDALKSVYERYQDKEFEIVGISLDRNETTVREFAADRRVTWELALASSSDSGVREKFRVVTIPSTFVLDRERKIVLVDGNARDVSLLLRHLTTQATTKSSE